MLIGTDNKRTQYLSSKQRVKSGEKGIGRFALDRLGSKCKMYTKNHSEDLICWETDWSNFEKAGQIIDDVEADFFYCSGLQFEDVIPAEIKESLESFASEANDEQFALNSGTLFAISGLRDKWTDHEKEKVIDVLGYLIPPVEQQSYAIITQNNLKSVAAKVDNDVTDDYKLSSQRAISYSGVSLAKELHLRLLGFPIFVLTTYQDDLFDHELFDSYLVFDFDRYIGEDQERIELNSKLIEQIKKHHSEIENWKKELESQLPHAGESAAIDERILELDSLLEKSIDGRAAIPLPVKRDFTAKKISELISKIDSLIEGK